VTAISLAAARPSLIHFREMNENEGPAGLFVLRNNFWKKKKMEEKTDEPGEFSGAEIDKKKKKKERNVMDEIE
jgi:hypothetical protein